LAKDNKNSTRDAKPEEAQKPKKMAPAGMRIVKTPVGEKKAKAKRIKSITPEHQQNGIKTKGGDRKKLSTHPSAPESGKGCSRQGCPQN